MGIEDRKRPGEAWLIETVRQAWKFKLAVSLTLDTEQRLREAAEAEAIRVFGRNLHDLLLAASAGHRVTMGLDPGIRTGVKVAVVDGTGRLLETATVHPHEPRNDWEGAIRTLAALAAKHRVDLVAIGHGTASAPLLSRISGLTDTLARNIVSYRDEHGPFRRRQQLLNVPRIGDRTFQRAAAFLRTLDGDDPLDRSAVHPEAYPVVERIAAKTGMPARELIGKSTVLRALRPEDFADTQFGEPTVRDILKELEKPGRDPRPEFRTAAFKEGVRGMADLQPGMALEGVVTNVANFGAFVDIGVHQDGLIHVSQLADRFVKDPRDVVQAGQIVKVNVLDVDVRRRRIALTMKNAEGSQRSTGRSQKNTGGPGNKPNGSPATSMAAAFAKRDEGRR